MTNTVDAALNFLAMVGIIYVLFWFIPSVVLESGRQKVFKVRDDIFDYAVDHPEKLNKEEHYAIRNELNKFIVAMEYMTFPRLITGAIFHKKGLGSDMPFSKLYKDIEDEKTQEFVKASLKKALMIIPITMLLRSPLAMLLLATIGLLAAIVNFVSPVNKRTQAKFKSRMSQEIYENISHVQA